VSGESLARVIAEDDGLSAKLKDRLDQRTLSDPDFWSFNALRSRSGNHALFQYPAMMVPELQGALLDDLIAIEPTASLVYDPFAGSGTVMLESLYRGLDFHGSDINPLAILLSQVKSIPPSVETLASAKAEVLVGVAALKEVDPPVFAGIEKWFKPEIRSGLARLRGAIAAVDDLTARRFLWVCLAETIRLVSNSRISTFKLHTYPAEEIARREVDAVKVFEGVATQNSERLTQHWERVTKIPSERSGPTALLLPGSVSDRWVAPKRADVLMTSPPYGDNKTTVPYGQHSYLPLCWIDTNDIPGGFDRTLLDSTARIDSLSLGGSIKNADDARDDLTSVSPSLGNFLVLIDDTAPLRKKVLSFVRDYRSALQAIRPRLKDGAFCFLTLGERQVGRQTFPLVDITRELLNADGHEEVTTIERVLPGSRKRMAAKNNQGDTMAQEWILVTRSWAASRGNRP
jgi:hypothetical protein